MSRTSDALAPVVEFDEHVVGSKGPFHPAYRSSERERRYGWFCSNCGTFDCVMDTAGRIECTECGNLHTAENWDAGYL
ncbi:MAG: DUF5816 domain-containing protein [Halodesulfurarchaeum sp.]